MMKGLKEKGEKATWRVGPIKGSLVFQEETWMVLVSVLREALGAQRAGLPPWGWRPKWKGQVPEVQWVRHTVSSCGWKQSQAEALVFHKHCCMMCQGAREPLQRTMVGIGTGSPAVRRLKTFYSFTLDLQKTWFKCI